MSPVIIHKPGKPRVHSELSGREVLWRYLDAAKFFDFIHQKTLFFCRGDQFGDKFEGAFTESLKHAIEKSYHDNKIDFTYEEFRNRLRERVFVNCWHKSINDSMAMWSIYGRSSCSVAITTTVEQLKNALLEQQLPYDISIERVEYVKHWRDPSLDIAPYSRVFAYKTKAYDFEKEVRVLIDRSAGEFQAVMPDGGMAVKVNHVTLLRSIVVAPEAPVWFETLVREASESYEILAPVRRSKLATDPV
jgi:hypothetical protein